MVEFKASDWVTVGNNSYFTPGKKYQVISDGEGGLCVLDDDGEGWGSVIRSYKHHKTEKTTPPEPPQTIQAHGREYALVPIEPPKPHEWKFPQWARHEKRGLVLVFGNGATGFVLFVSQHGASHCPSDELTYICDAEIPK